MSTQIGTLQPRPRYGHLIGPVVAIALIATAAIGTTTIVLDRGETSGVSDRARVINADAGRWSAAATQFQALGSSAAVLGVNTPSELGAVGFGETSIVGSSANTPSEMRGGFDEPETSGPREDSPIGFHPLP